MKIAIRLGYSVDANDTERYRELQILKELGIIEISEEVYQVCRKCNARTLIDPTFLRERSSKCSGCEKTIQITKNQIISFRINGINYPVVKKICEERIASVIGKENCKYDVDRRMWVCKHNGKAIPIFVSHFSSYNAFILGQNEEDWLCIMLDPDMLSGNIHHYNEYNFIKFVDLLKDNIELKSTIDALSSSYTPNSFFELDQKFDSFIKSINPTDFEKRFIDDFLGELQAKQQQLKTFFNYLSSRRSTIINSKIVKLGGAGNPDFISIDLLEYLQECLKPNKIGEAKRYYRTTSFAVKDFAVATLHAHDSDTLSIVSTNKIQPEVWKTIIDMRQINKYYKHTIMDKDIILLLINVLQMQDLLSIEKIS
jgi:ribosomal protein L40E